jgi:hypothetical protein
VLRSVRNRTVHVERPIQDRLRQVWRQHTLSQGDFVRVASTMAHKFVTREEGATLLVLGGTPGQPYAPAMGTPMELPAQD